MGAKGTEIIFGGGVYVAENTRVPDECESHSLGEEEQRND